MSTNPIKIGPNFSDRDARTLAGSVCKARVVEPSDIYPISRQRMLDLAPTLSADQLAAPLPATPPWVLLDGYRHLAGVCADVLDGVMEGAGSPAWTAQQIGCRAGHSLADVCAEWAGRGPLLDAQVAAAGRAMSFVAFDTWTHEQDIRAAAGLEGLRDDVATALAGIAAAALDGRYTSKGAPTIAIDLGMSQATMGAGDAEVSLTTTPYELLRMIFGRRSLAQMHSAAWSGAGDVGAAIEALHLFDLPTADIHD